MILSYFDYKCLTLDILSLSVDVFVLLELAPVATGLAVFVESCSLEFCCRVFSTEENDGYLGTAISGSSMGFIWTDWESWNDSGQGCGAGEDCGDWTFALRDAWRLVISGMMLLLDTPRPGTVASPSKVTVMTSFVEKNRAVFAWLFRLLWNSENEKMRDVKQNHKSYFIPYNDCQKGNSLCSSE